MSRRSAVAARPQLGRDVVIERAVELADAEGLEAVTIRRLAQEFGVTPMALYWHFSSKDELLEALGDHVLAGVDVPPDPTAAWDVQLERLLGALVTALRSHPSIASLAAERILMSKAGLDLTEQTLALLRGVGFSFDQAAMLAHHALLTALMLVTGEPGAENQVSAAERDDRLARKSAAVRALPPEQYPNMIAAFGSFVNCSDEDGYYDSGVDLFVAGVRGMREKLAVTGN